MSADIEVCSYCERPTFIWCDECFGCPDCCPTGEHCEMCGMSLLQCERQLCGGLRELDEPQPVSDSTDTHGQTWRDRPPLL